ncbi:MAG TPA: gliding motility protein GldM [Saprospiraceae bacterium]|nr:gliding motility protein GldM [Saprospiraceae bacterium]HPI08174.1 gliding motility protein GldM [Saprospiraceae bacterium]
MSIPKEPRQLMINLMYLVLTALLALNVSAEVMNAFFSLDRGLSSSRAIVEKNNEQLMGSIDTQADAYKNELNEKYRSNAKQAQQIAAEFTSYIETVRTAVFDLGKGPSKNDPTIPKDIRNKDVTTRYFINEKKGEEIEAKINETRQKLLALADNDKGVESSLPLMVEALPAKTTANNWAEFKFKQMPVAAVFPILGKMQSDAKNSATAILNYCSNKMGAEKIVFDKFTPAVSPEKSYVIAGDKYVADVFLSAYSSSADNISINVNGSNLPLKEGIAHYETSTSGVGERTYKVNISLKNPVTGKTDTYSKEFKYEVGQRSVAVSLDKMNVFYIGVDNPISVSAAGVSSNEVRVSGSGSGISVNGAGGGGKYNVRVGTPGEASLTVSGGGASQTFKYRVKRIPDPTPQIGKKKGGQFGNGEFKAQGGIAAVLENFDFDVKCDMVGFEFTYLAKRQDAVTATNSGARWGAQAAAMVEKAKPGDAYFFDDIKCKCPGDVAARNIGSIAVKIR